MRRDKIVMQETRRLYEKCKKGGLSSEFKRRSQMEVSKLRERYGRLLRDNHGVIGFLVATKETIISLLK